MPAGRPRIEIKKEEFEKLCGLQCTLEEIASFFNCSDDTIERWCVRNYNCNFADVYKKHAGKGKIALRRYQFNLAKTNPTMAIWLGRQMLGQRDRFETTDKEIYDRLDHILEDLNKTAKEDV